MKHVVLVVVCYKSITERSRSRQRNEPAVDSSCASFAFTIYHENKTKVVDVMDSRQNHKKLKRVQDYLDSVQKHDCGTIVERYHIECACTNKDTRSPTLKNLTERRMTSVKKVDQYKVVRPNQGRGSSTAKTEERPENKQTVQWERENLTNHSPDPDAEQLVIVVIMDMVTFDKVFLVGFFIIAIMATSSDFTAHVMNKM